MSLPVDTNPTPVLKFATDSNLQNSNVEAIEAQFGELFQGATRQVDSRAPRPSENRSRVRDTEKPARRADDSKTAKSERLQETRERPQRKERLEESNRDASVTRRDSNDLEQNESAVASGKDTEDVSQSASGEPQEDDAQIKSSEEGENAANSNDEFDTGSDASDSDTETSEQVTVAQNAIVTSQVAEPELALDLENVAISKAIVETAESTSDLSAEAVEAANEAPATTDAKFETAETTPSELDPTLVAGDAEASSSNFVVSSTGEENSGNEAIQKKDSVNPQDDLSLSISTDASEAVNQTSQLSEEKQENDTSESESSNRAFVRRFKVSASEVDSAFTKVIRQLTGSQAQNDALTQGDDSTGENLVEKNDNPERASQQASANLVEANSTEAIKATEAVQSSATADTTTTASDAVGRSEGRVQRQLVGKATNQTGEAEGPSTVNRTRFVQRVAQAFRSAQDRGGEVRLRLSPPELGSMLLQLKVDGGTMNARIEADNVHAQTLLVENLPALRERLAEIHMTIEQFDVDLTDRHTQDPTENFSEGRHHFGRQTRDTGPEESASAEEPSTNITVDVDSLDVRI